MPRIGQAKEPSPSARKPGAARRPAGRSTKPGQASEPTVSPQAQADPRSASAPEVLQLQRQYGNRAVQRLIQRALPPAQRPAPSGAQGGEVSPDLEQRLQAARGGGRPLDEGLGARVGGALGADFSGVRVHTGPAADDLSRSLGAMAFTTGSDIFFSQGAYQPETHSGQTLLAHELTHVVQQGAAISSQAPARRAAADQAAYEPGPPADESLTARGPAIQREIGTGNAAGDGVLSDMADNWTIVSVAERDGKRFYTLKHDETGEIRKDVPHDTDEFHAGAKQPRAVQPVAPQQPVPVVQPWDSVTRVEYYDSGNGGAFGVTFQAHPKQVVKGAYPSEVAGSLLARKMGLQTPDVRVVADESAEYRAIKHAIEQPGQYRLAQAVKGRPLLLLVDFVDERTLSQVGDQKLLPPQEALQLAPEIGRWFALHLLIRDTDNFGYFQNAPGGSVNSSNFFVGSGPRRGRVIGIDQNVSGTNLDKAQSAIAAIKQKEEYFAYSAAGGIAQLLGVDGEQFAPGFLKGAQQGLAMIQQNIQPQDIAQIAEQTDLPDGLTEALQRILQTIRQ